MTALQLNAEMNAWLNSTQNHYGEIGLVNGADGLLPSIA